MTEPADVAAEAFTMDTTYFAEHPNRTFMIRGVLAGEADAAAGDTHAIVSRREDGSLNRVFFSLTPQPPGFLDTINEHELGDVWLAAAIREMHDPGRFNWLTALMRLQPKSDSDTLQ